MTALDNLPSGVIELSRAPVEKRSDLRGPHLLRVTLPVEENEIPHPVPVSLLRPPAIVLGADHLAQPVEQTGSWRRQTRNIRRIRMLIHFQPDNKGVVRIYSKPTC